MAIEPIKGFYVHDEVTDTDGVAKYDAGSLDGLDETVSLVGYAPDAKAVGDRLTDVENLAERLNEGGLELKDEVIGENVDDWMDTHPEASTTVLDDSLTTEKYKDGSVTTPKLADGAVTESKLAPASVVEGKVNVNFLAKIKNVYVTPEQFGAAGDGTTDDTAAVQEACDAGLPVLAVNTYRITDDIHIKNDFYGNTFYIDDGEFYLDANRRNVYIKFMTGNKYQTPDRTAFNIEGHALNNVSISEITGFEKTLRLYSNSDGVYRNTVTIDRSACLHGVYIETESNGWVNDNVVDMRHHLYDYSVSGDSYTVYMDSRGTSRINSNRIKIDYEKYKDFQYNVHLAYINKGNGNTINVVRCETGPYTTVLTDFVKFEGNSENNAVIFERDGMINKITCTNHATELNDVIVRGVSYWDNFYKLYPWRWKAQGNKVGTDHGLAAYSSGAIVDYSSTQETNGIAYTSFDEQYIYRSPYFDIRRKSSGDFYIILGYVSPTDEWRNTAVTCYLRMYDANGTPLDYSHIIRPDNDILNAYFSGYITDQSTNAVRVNERINNTRGAAFFFDEDVSRVEFIGMGRGWSIRVSNTAIAN